jgi:hypothetical protein
MLSFAASIIIGVCVLAYAARCFLVIVQETAHGQDEIVWPNEPYQDWLGHAVQFLELLGIWIAPAALMARLLRHEWLSDDAALRILLLVGPGLWLFFPIGLLSSLSAESRWVPFRWTIFVSFLRLAPAAVVFYILTASMLGAAVALWYYGLFGGRTVLMPAAAGVGGAVWFIYARLLGRLALMIQLLPDRKRAPARATSPQPPPRRKPKRKPSRRVQDPWASPEEQERKRDQTERFPWAKQPPKQPKPGLHIPSAYEIEGYGFAGEKPAAPEPPPVKPPRSRFAKSPEEYEPYQASGPSKPAPPTASDPQDPVFAEQVRQHIAERTHTLPTLPPHPFLKGVYTFPFYFACLPNWLALSLAFLAEGGIVYLMLEFGRDLFHG